MTVTAIPSPAWVTFEAEEPTGLDLLGLRAPVQAIGNQLLNGLTTVTPKPRYLSILSWAIARYLNAGLPDRWQEFRQFVAAQEAALVMANVVRDRSTQRLVGITEAIKRVDKGTAALSLEPLVQQIALNIYASSSVDLGLTFASDSGVMGLSKERGAKLAQAFEVCVEKTRYANRLAAKKSILRIPRTEIDELAKRFLLDELPAREATILIDALMPPEPRLNSVEPSRLTPLTILLWLAHEKSAIPTEQSLFEAALDPTANPPAALRRTLDGWLVYAVRDLLAVVHEAVFQATMSEIDVITGERGARYADLGALNEFSEAVGDGTLWIALMAALMTDGDEPTEALLPQTAALSAVYKSRDLLVRSDAVRLSWMLRRLSIQNAESQVVERVGIIVNAFSQLLSLLEDLWPTLSNEQKSPRSLQSANALLWHPDWGWCLTDDSPAETIRTGYINIETAVSDHPEIAVAIGQVRQAWRSDTGT